MQSRLAVDIGGTFTDLVLSQGDRRWTLKTPTTAAAPEEGFLIGVERIMALSGVAPGDIGQIVHGTTLATNALIERKGARTAMLVTQGFRDTVEIAYENRFEQYDVFMQKPRPLVPRAWRFDVPERIGADGQVLRALDEGAVDAIIRTLKDEAIESVAICCMHSYRDLSHEKRIAARLAAQLPRIAITLSGEVSPEIREYDRWSTAAANAYVQPMMDRYLARLEISLKERGLGCQLLMINSGGGLTSVASARRFPIRLVESGPAGGAILAAHIGKRAGLADVLSFDMGGTTAKVCLIDDGEMERSRVFEVDRQYRFMKGSGLPLRIPVIEMVEIGAGGGSLASVDALKRIQVGPKSAQSVPGPACYDRGGENPAVTDADLILGKLDVERFGDGAIRLRPERAEAAIQRGVASVLGLSVKQAAHGIAEVVEENMASAARLHAVERGKDLKSRTLIAFGGAAPLHAVRLAEKLGISRVVVPKGAGVGSAIGFLLAPVAYDVVRSRVKVVDDKLDLSSIDALFAEMRAEAMDVLSPAPGTPLVERRHAEMRYVGQGHELTVEIPDCAPQDLPGVLNEAFRAAYTATFGRQIPGLPVEVTNWMLRLSVAGKAPDRAAQVAGARDAAPMGHRPLYDAGTADTVQAPEYWRPDLKAGDRMRGPALISEHQTTIVVTSNFDAFIDGDDNVVLDRRSKTGN